MLERYLELCESDRNQEWFDRQQNQENPQKNLNREEEIEKVVNELHNLLEKATISGNDSDLVKKIKQALERAQEWLISRYNLSKAREIAMGAIKPREKGAKRRGWRQMTQLLASTFLPEIIAAAVLFVIFGALIPGWPGVARYCRWLSPWAFGCLYGAVIMMLVRLIYLALRRDRNVNLQIHLPRVAAGIIVGYFLLLNDEAWGGFFTAYCAFTAKNAHLNYWLIAAKWFLPLAGVFCYIVIAMNNVSGIKYPLFWKAGALFLRGYAYAILMGVLVCDVFGQAFAERLVTPDPICTIFTETEMFSTEAWFTELCNTSLNPVPLQGALGAIYPEAILYLPPLALFVGVFLQLLWQGKGLTEKI